jgi:hypothetical protein
MLVLLFSGKEYTEWYFFNDACFRTDVETQTGKVTDHVTKIPMQCVA